MAQHRGPGRRHPRRRRARLPALVQSQITGREDGELGPTNLRASDEQLRTFYGSDGTWEHVERSVSAERNTLDQTPCRAASDVCGDSRRRASSAPATASRRRPAICASSRSPRLARLAAAEAIPRAQLGPHRRVQRLRRAQVLLALPRDGVPLEDGKLDGPSREACRHAVILRDLLRERGVIPGSDTAMPPGMSAKRRLRVVQ